MHPIRSLLHLAFGAVCLSSACFGQNSSLFQRPISFSTPQTAMEPRAEVFPPPGSSVQTSEPLATMPGANYGPPASMTGNMLGAMPSSSAQAAMDNASLLGLQSSWSYAPPTPTRVLKLHDIISIRVDEAATSLALGNATSRKTTSYDAVLRDWIRMVGLDTIKPAPQSDGDPRIQANQNEVYRGDSTLRTSESFTTNIAAEIVDIKPNGLIVLSASKKLIQNDNTFEISLTGTCRSQDIGPDNTVLSRNLIHSTINKQDQGHVRDGYSRGWLTKLVARIKPF
jgi:flagellar L-ring protein precursor FlgH